MLHFSNSSYMLAFSVVLEANAGAGVLFAALRYNVFAFATCDLEFSDTLNRARNYFDIP
jgi:hypothetical protein